MVWSVRHGIFRSRFQRSILAVRIIRYGRGKDACGFWADWIATLVYIIYRRTMGKNLKIFFSVTARPTANRFMSWMIYVISDLFLLCFCARMFIDAL